MGIHPKGRQPIQVSNVHIKGGRLIDPRNRIDAKQDVFVADGKIAALGRPPAGFRAERTIDAANLVVCPGLIDLSARLREPGFEYRATLEDRKSTRLNSSHPSISYAVFCLKKKKKI